jgi:hypothetical protein
MAQIDARQKLVHFLEEKAFRPVLRANPENLPPNQRDKLKDLQQRTEQEIERFHGYKSADDVVTNFRRDLSSEPAKKVHRELRQLGLPTIDDVREEFDRLAMQLSVARS